MGDVIDEGIDETRFDPELRIIEVGYRYREVYYKVQPTMFEIFH